jgi:type IV secretion system protein VirD4
LQEKHGFCINPFNMHVGAPWFLPSHRVNPLDVLHPLSESLAADCKLLMEMMIPKVKTGGDNYFPDKAREWGRVILLWMVRRGGSVTLPAFYKLISAVYADLTGWDSICAQMRTFSHPDIQRVVGEMVTKRDEAPKEFSGILGTLFNGLSFVGDEALSACLADADFSLSVVTSDFQPVNVYLIFPSEFMEMYAPFLRLIIGVAMIYKSRAPASPPVVFLIDEAAQLGYFEALQRAYGIGRGKGIRTWAFFQSMGDIEGHYGRDGAKAMMSSAQLRQFFGVRDFETARMVSDMVGQATVFYDDPIQQENYKMQGLGAVLRGATDPVDLIHAAHNIKMSQEKSIARRDLIAPDEVLGLPPNEQIAFIGDLSLATVRAKRRHYYERADLAGRYLPNPFHPPYDQVAVKRKERVISAPVVSSAVSNDLAGLPQYQAGQMSFVDLPLALGRPRLSFLKRLIGG